MIASASDEAPPLFPRFLAGGPEQLRLAPASAALLIGYGALIQLASSAILGRRAQYGWLILSESAAATIVGALLTAMLATRWLGKPLGLAAGLLQLTCLYALGLPTASKPAEWLITLFVTASMGIFARANVPGRLPEDARRRMHVFFYGCVAALLLLCRGWGEFAGVLLACLIYLLANQDGRAFHFFVRPLGLSVAAVFAVCTLWLQLAASPPMIAEMVRPFTVSSSAAWPSLVSELRWLGVLAVGMFPWWPFCAVAIVAGYRRGDYATAFWQLVACWSLAPMALAAVGLLDGRSVLAMTCGPLSIFSAAGLYDGVRWWRLRAAKRCRLRPGKMKTPGRSTRSAARR